MTVGPILLGAGRPVHVLTASATVRRLVNITAIAVVDSEELRSARTDRCAEPLARGSASCPFPCRRFRLADMGVMLRGRSSALESKAPDRARGAWRYGMSRVIRFHETGGPEVLRWGVPRGGAAGASEARSALCGRLNYIDTYHRSGLYPVPLPSGIGLEGAGVVEAVGEGVTEVRPGDRVAYAGGPLGAYAEVRNIPAANLVELPAEIDFETGAAMMLQGMTAQYLLRRTYRVKPGDTISFMPPRAGSG